MAAKRDFLSLLDYDRKELDLLLELATTLKDAWRKRRAEPRLAGKVLGMVFHKPSLRTRLSFEVAMQQLGGHALYITDQEIGLGKRESIYDVGQVMARFVSGIMIRTFAQAPVVELARSTPIPVINGLTDHSHPCQVFCDLLTIREKGFSLDEIKVAYLGDGNNVVHSWIYAARAYRFDFWFAGPEGYDPSPEVVRSAEGRGKVQLTRSVEEAVRGAHVIYTDTWTSMGQEDEAAKRARVFPPYQVNAKTLSLADPRAIVMHCLPAHRGQEIVDEVMDGPQSVVFDQAENRLHGQKAILVHCLGGYGRERLTRIPVSGIAVTFAILLATQIAGCAQVEAPSGGPLDQSAPRVLDTFPDSAAVRVPAVDSLVFLFSEPMNKTSVEEAFFLSPPVEYRSRSWEDQTWVLRLTRPLEIGRTYVGLLGTQALDRRRNPLPKPWSFAFTTGETLDTGRVSGKVVGQRYPGKGVFLYLWPWETDPPDTTREGYPPDPLRLTQADAEGKYELAYLPRERALRVCALFDRDSDRKFDPTADLWTCHPDPVQLADTSAGLTGLDLYLSAEDEPGAVIGAVVDSLCRPKEVKAMFESIEAKRDSLRDALEDLESDEDSVVIGAAGAVEEAAWDSLEAIARAESTYCAQPVVVQLVSEGDAVVREAKGDGRFEWKDVPAGIYRLRAYRDLDQGGTAGNDEPAGAYPYALEVKPLRVLDRLEISLRPASAGP